MVSERTLKISLRSTIACIAILAAVIYLVINSKRVQLVLSDCSPSLFERFWIAELAQMQTPRDFESLTIDGRPFVMLNKVFLDGSWLFGRLDSTDGGDYFDGTVFLGSNGEIYVTSYPFSGYEGFGEEAGSIHAKSLEEFIELGTKFHFQAVGKNEHVRRLKESVSNGNSRRRNAWTGHSELVPQK